MSLFPPSDLKLIPNKLQSILFLALFTKFKLDAKREIYEKFPKVTYLGCNLGACRNPKYLGLYLRKYREPKSKIWAQASPELRLKQVLILESKTSQKNKYRENSTMTCLRWNYRFLKNPNFLRSYLRKYRERRSEIWTRGLESFRLK